MEDLNKIELLELQIKLMNESRELIYKIQEIQKKINPKTLTYTNGQIVELLLLEEKRNAYDKVICKTIEFIKEIEENEKYTMKDSLLQDIAKIFLDKRSVDIYYNNNYIGEFKEQKCIGEWLLNKIVDCVNLRLSKNTEIFLIDHKEN